MMRENNPFKGWHLTVGAYFLSHNALLPTGKTETLDACILKRYVQYVSKSWKYGLYKFLQKPLCWVVREVKLDDKCGIKGVNRGKFTAVKGLWSWCLSVQPSSVQTTRIPAIITVMIILFSTGYLSPWQETSCCQSYEPQ